jgi:hypothetical protein
MNLKNMKIDIDNESLHIFIDNGEDIDPLSICYWHLDEVEEDASVCIPMLRAVELFYTDKQKLVDLLNLGK